MLTAQDQHSRPRAGTGKFGNLEGCKLDQNRGIIGSCLWRVLGEEATYCLSWNLANRASMTEAQLKPADTS